MNDSDDNGSGLPSDLERLVNLEIGLRNLTGAWHSASEVVGRLAGKREYEAQARPLRYGLGQCSLEVLITSLAALRGLLERPR